MAVTKIKPIKSTLSKALDKPIKSTLSKALDYIQNPDKTEGKTLVSSFGCSYETADIEFEYTLSQARQKGNNLAFHLIQSFEPGEVDCEKAHAIGKQLADAVTKGQHEYVLTTHIDKGHIHNHIIFCAVNFVDYHKYNSNKRSYYGIRNMSDKLCRENGLSVVVPGKGSKGKSYAEYQAEKAGTSWKGKLKIAVDTLIPQVASFEELLQRLQAAGYEIKPGKYISCRAPGQERFTRLKTLEPGEVDCEKAHAIGKQLADAVTKGQHEYVLTTHIDKGHIHNHIIFCAVNFVDYHKYNSNKRSYYGIRNMSDKLCRENGLSVVVPGKGSKGKSYAEYQAEKAGTSWKGKLKIAVDTLIPQVASFEELLQRLQAAGYEIKPGKYISCRAPGQERFTRLKTLGADYTEEAIKERIAGKRTKTAKAPKEQRGVSLLIDIENSIKAQESRSRNGKKVKNVSSFVHTYVI